MNQYRRTAELLTVTVLCFSVITACTSMGSHNLPRDRFNYNAAIAQSRNQQMLLNVVRLRYLDMPDFIAVSSVITNYRYDGDIGISRTRTDSNNALVPETLTGEANLAYSERPTITYSPLDGADFSRRMLRPIPVEVIFSLGQAGWPLDILLTIALQRMNEVENMGFGQVPTPGDVDRDNQFQKEARNLERFQRVLELLLILSQEGAIEVQYRERKGEKVPHLNFARKRSEQISALIDELKEILNLNPQRDTFRITDRMTGRDVDEITMQSRSLLSIMSFLSRGTQIPDRDVNSGRVVAIPPNVLETIQERVPLNIRSSQARPSDPYVAVKYRSNWFYIDHADIRSKRTFATMLVLYNLTAPTGSKAAPLLSLPTG